MFDSIAAKNLVWFPEKDMGYFPVEGFVYDDEYFGKYEGYAGTKMGELLTAARIEFVNKHYAGELVDVGIGCGQFIERRGNAKGYDVNPVGKRWLHSRGLWRDIYDGKGCVAATFWDSLEHIKDIQEVVKQVQQFAFLSIPIFTGPCHVLRSKHYRRDEHYWYFTHAGIINWFREQGFGIIDHSTIEQGFGREDIGTYAFWRTHA